MRLSDYILNPEKLEDLLSYSIVVLLSMIVFAFWFFVEIKEKLWDIIN